MSENELEQLLFESQRNNSKHGITGLLLYTDMKFVQVIEGEEPAIMNLYSNLKSDFRHNNVKVIIQGPIKKRSYTKWSMGYKSMMPDEIMEKLGYRDPHQYFEEHPLTNDSHVYELFMKLFFDKHFKQMEPSS